MGGSSAGGPTIFDLDNGAAHTGLGRGLPHVADADAEVVDFVVAAVQNCEGVAWAPERLTGTEGDGVEGLVGGIVEDHHCFGPGGRWVRRLRGWVLL